MKKITTIVLLFLWSAAGYSQQIDTTGIYGERKDSLDAAVFTERNPSNYLSKGKEIRTEIISADGLMKADLRAAKEKYDKWTAIRRENREFARKQAQKHREILAQVEAELNLPKSLRRYATKAMHKE